ncbi:MAG: FAD-binding protein [Acidobacteriota bacterium]|nr:FAD-binding protein [Acidobacteriota bacterium]
MIHRSQVDLLILGMGAGAAMCALSALDADPSLRILIVTRALRGKGGSSRMVSGGLNVAFGGADACERHFRDTIKTGQCINDQRLVRRLVECAPATVLEMENRFGCYFDRDGQGRRMMREMEDGSNDHRVFHGSTTGLHVITCFAEQILKRRIPVWEECRAVDLLLNSDGSGVTGALLFDQRRGEWRAVTSGATVVATGGGPAQYQFHASGADKTADGLAMLFRAGAWLRDMEMIQFHPACLLVPGSSATGGVFEKGLRTSGAHLYNGLGEPLLHKSPGSGEGSSRDLLCRRSYIEIVSGRACASGGIEMDASHLGEEFISREYPLMAQRFRQFGYDPARCRIPLIPAAQLFMGGAQVSEEGRGSLARLFVVGEDAGGIHGANRHGGNGLAAACVFGRLAGKAIAASLTLRSAVEESPAKEIEDMVLRLGQPFHTSSRLSSFHLCSELQKINWLNVGPVRERAKLDQAITAVDAIEGESAHVSVGGHLASNSAFAAALDLRNMIAISRLVIASAARRQESRGAHGRLDFEEQRDEYGMFNSFLRHTENGRFEMESRPVEFPYLSVAEFREHRKKGKKRAHEGITESTTAPLEADSARHRDHVSDPAPSNDFNGDITPRDASHPQGARSHGRKQL